MTVSPEEEAAVEVRRLGLACRIGFLIIALIGGFLSFRLAVSVGLFETLFADMFGGKPLPPLTTIALQGKVVWMGVTVVGALAALGLAYLPKRASTSVISLAVITGILAIQSIFLWTTLSLPLMNIFTGMQSGE